MSSISKNSLAASARIKKRAKAAVIESVKPLVATKRRAKSAVKARSNIKKSEVVTFVQEDLSDLAPTRAKMRRLQAGRSVKAEWFEDGYSEELSK